MNEPTGIPIQTTRGFNLIFLHSSLDEAQLSSDAFRVLAHLSRRAGSGKAWPGVESVSRICLISIKAVRKSLKELHARRFIIIRERPGKTNFYYLTDPSKWIMDPKAANNSSPVEPEGGIEMGSNPGRNGARPLSETTDESNPRKESNEGNPKESLVSFPENLDTPEFKTAWSEWEQHRREIKKKLTPISVSKQLLQLSRIGVDRAIAAIDFTISKGWQGIREDDKMSLEQAKTQTNGVLWKSYTLDEWNALTKDQQNKCNGDLVPMGAEYK